MTAPTKLLGLAFSFSIAAGCSGPEYPNCDDDSSCREGEFCVQGQCQQCRPGGEDCALGEECNDGRCDPIEGFCESDAQCAEDETCVEERCAPREEPVAEPEPEPEPEPEEPCTLAGVSFDFDSSEVSEEAGRAIGANAACVEEREIPQVQLTGHCDSRGTEEYNLALGQQRAQAVLTYMEHLGVDSEGLSTHSMGEEGASDEDDEDAWAADRRVDFEEH